jgi:hypothetical protein
LERLEAGTPKTNGDIAACAEDIHRLDKQIAENSARLLEYIRKNVRELNTAKLMRKYNDDDI